ncbi:MAG TPA: iron ABC transporter permease [Alphaproteobacteria bacterium]|nr:iron ABC transporter permease [Alphaproteobacteria bacterium]
MIGTAATVRRSDVGAFRLLRPRWPSPERALFIAAAFAVTLLVAPPLVAVVATSIGQGAAAALLTPLHQPAILLNTLVLGLAATTGAVTIGGGLALMLGGNGVPGRGLLERLVIVPLYLTPLLTAIGWSWIGSPRSGLLNLFLHGVGLTEVDVNMVSAGGVVAVSILSYAPLPFLLISDALRGIDAAMIEAARVHGASRRFALRRIVLPLLLPAALASSLLVFVQAIGMFSVPAVLGMPSGFNVATTEIFRLLENYPPRIGEATAWGLYLLAVTAALTFAQSVLLGRRSFATITGKSFRPHVPGRSKARHLYAAAAWLYVLLATVLPLLALLWAASIDFVTADPRLMRLTARHFAFVLFQYPKTWLAAGNSALLGVATATLVTLLGLAVSWVVIRTRLRGRTSLDQLSMVPLSMPAMVFALGLLWVYVAIPFLPIYGTIGILLVAYVTHYLPFGVRAAAGAIRQLHPELEEAARVAGASWLQSMRWITMPLLRPALFASWILLFVMALHEVSASILLYTSSSTVLSVTTFDLWENGNPSDVAALGFAQLAATFVIVGFLLRARRRAVLA